MTHPTGTAIYVYGVLAQTDAFPRSWADLLFFIDGRATGSFQYSPPDPPVPHKYIYGSLLWYNDSLAYGQHTFTLQNGVPGGSVSLILFDFVVYTRLVVYKLDRKSVV